MAICRQAFGPVVFLLVFCAAARADTVRLKTGGLIPQAKIVREDNDKVYLRTPGSHMGVPKDLIVTIEKGESLFDTFEKMRERVKDTDGPGLFKLAQWCKDNGLREEFYAVLLKTIEAKPDHLEARHFLGHVRKGEGWQELPPLTLKVRMVGDREFKEHIEQQLNILFETRKDLQLFEEIDEDDAPKAPTSMVEIETRVNAGTSAAAKFYGQTIRGPTVFADLKLSAQGGFLGRTPISLDLQGEVSSGVPGGKELALVDGFNRNHKKIHDFLDTIVAKRVASLEPKPAKDEKAGQKKSDKKAAKAAEKKTPKK